MLNLAPLPDWRSLLNGLLPRTIRIEELAKPWTRDKEISGWFSRSAWALARVVLWRQRHTKSEAITIFVPSFFCNMSLAPVRALGVRLSFYPVTKDMLPDYQSLRVLAKREAPDILLLVHYFGNPSPVAPASEFCKHFSAWLVEDAAHILRPIAGVGKHSDFVLFSLHKLLPIPDGAILVARPDGPGKLGFAGLAGLGDPLRWHEELTSHEILSRLSFQAHVRVLPIWLVKRIAQKFGIASRRLKHSFTEEGDDLTGSNFTLSEPAISSLALHCIEYLLPSLAQISKWRIRNQLVWDEILLIEGARKYDGLNKIDRPNYSNWTPYQAAYTTDEKRRRAKHIFEIMRGAGMPVMTWPDLPPEVQEEKDTQAEAWGLRHRQIYLPVHQSLSAKSIIFSTNGKRAVPDDSTEFRVKLFWDTASSADWHDWLLKVGRSNLLQSWEYGEAKASIDSWNVRRGLFHVNGKVVAIVQVLEKKYIGILKVSRVNRGPLFVEALPIVLKEHIFKLLIETLSKTYRGCLFSYSPELPLTGESICMMTRLGMRQCSPDGWQSVFVDLGKDPEVMRKRLDDKWRNMLSYADRKNLRFVVETDKESFEWIVRQCSAMMLDKEMSDIPVSLYRNLRSQLYSNRHAGMVFQAFSGNERIAGLWIVPHGVTATYLLGWNGAIGRKMKANQFLLWQAMIYLKKAGYQWLDLGGIDEETTPGIAVFKLGINGQRYELIGDFWK